MPSEPKSSTTSPNAKIKLALYFAVQGDCRFLSHRDTAQLWQKALARARIPVTYTQGFNPHPRITLTLPRSVGMATQADLLIIQLNHHCSSETILAQLQHQLPKGIKPLAARQIPNHLDPTPSWAQYRITLSDGVDRNRLQQRIQQFLQAHNWPIHRPARPRHPARTLDLRDGIEQLTLKTQSLLCTVKIQPQATPRIDELLDMLEINKPKLVTEICRTNVGFPPELTFNN